MNFPQKQGKKARTRYLSAPQMNDDIETVDEIMIAVCCICDHQNEVEPKDREIVCEMCKTSLNVYEDGTTDLM